MSEQLVLTPCMLPAWYCGYTAINDMFWWRKTEIWQIKIIDLNDHNLNRENEWLQIHVNINGLIHTKIHVKQLKRHKRWKDVSRETVTAAICVTGTDRAGRAIMYRSAESLTLGPRVWWPSCFKMNLMAADIYRFAGIILCPGLKIFDSLEMKLDWPLLFSHSGQEY